MHRDRSSDNNPKALKTKVTNIITKEEHETFKEAYQFIRGKVANIRKVRDNGTIFRDKWLITSIKK